MSTTGFFLLFLSCERYAIHLCFKVSGNHSERIVIAWKQHTPDSKLWWCRKCSICLCPPTLSSFVETFWIEIVVLF